MLPYPVVQTIVIEKDEKGGFQVIENGVNSGQLGPGEMLQQVVGLLFDKPMRTYPMYTDEQWNHRRPAHYPEPSTTTGAPK